MAVPRYLYKTLFELPRLIFSIDLRAKTTFDSYDVLPFEKKSWAPNCQVSYEGNALWCILFSYLGTNVLLPLYMEKDNA